MNQDRKDRSRTEGGTPAADRREFLGRAARLAGSVATVVVAGDLALLIGGEARAEDGAYDITQHEWVYLIDINKCIGCGACVRACERENQVPPHFFRTWIERYLVSRTGEVTVDSPNGGHDGFEPPVTGLDVTKAFFVPKMCNHCRFTPCVQLCPVGASYRTEDGVVLVDQKRCIGCGYCVQACPYGSRFIHPETHAATKCTLCYHRITKGLPTACVGACPVRARLIGNRKSPGDEVFEIIATKEVRILKPELLTEPNCFYLGMGMEVR